jgi:hypothetical protein
MRITPVVHPMTARAENRAPGRGHESALTGTTFQTEPPTLRYYLLVPDPLISAFAHDALAIGVYVAIARLALAARDAVSLAARDLVTWMGSRRDADRAAIMRRIVKLEEQGWLIVERSRATKHRLLPSWGHDTNGTVRPWRFDDAYSGRPSHLRGRRVPLTLLDVYLGRLDPQPGHGQALISRYFTRPLLDLTDLGVYTIGLRAEVTPTPRLRHLGLHSTVGMLLPAENCSLLQLAAAGQLTTLEGDVAVAVRLSVQGHARLGLAAPTVDPHTIINDEQVCGSICGSADGSADGSDNLSSELSVFPHQDGQNISENVMSSLIAWDVGMIHESTNHDSTPDHELATGGGALSGVDESAMTSELPANGLATTQPRQVWLGADALAEIVSSLAAPVVAGHRALNPTRAIPAGEWCELLEFQNTYRVEQLLIWQARASRAGSKRPYGITPAYYQACAAQAACAAYRPSSTARLPASIAPAVVQETAPVPPALDPACDGLLQEMGVRERQQLAALSPELITAWQAALGHPGLAARFTSPVGFAVVQMRRGNRPPSSAELDHWAEQAHQKLDRYETWRYMDAAPIVDDTLAYEQQLEARVRQLVPPDADLAELCALASALEGGVSEAEALALIQARRTGGDA